MLVWILRLRSHWRFGWFDRLTNLISDLANFAQDDTESNVPLETCHAK